MLSSLDDFAIDLTSRSVKPVNPGALGGGTAGRYVYHSLLASMARLWHYPSKTSVSASKYSQGCTHHMRQLCHEPWGHGARRVGDYHAQRAQVGPGTRKHPHQEDAAGQPVPLKLLIAGLANHRRAAPHRLNDIEVDVPDKRPAVL